MPEIMVGIINPDGYEKVNRVYSTQGESPTITARDFKDPIKILDMRKINNTIIQTRPDQTRPDQTRPDQTRPDQTRPDLVAA